MTAPSKAREAFAAYRDANRARINARRRMRYAANPVPALEQNKLYRKRNAAKLNAQRRQRKYGSDGEEMFKQQCGLCAICGAGMLRRHRHRRAAHLDHDHRTKRIRGWLCHQCNLGLGHFNDDAGLLFAAVNYLRRA